MTKIGEAEDAYLGYQHVGEPTHRIARMARLRIKMAIDEFNLEYGSEILGYPPHICIDGENWYWDTLEKGGEI